MPRRHSAVHFRRLPFVSGLLIAMMVLVGGCVVTSCSSGASDAPAVTTLPTPSSGLPHSPSTLAPARTLAYPSVLPSHLGIGLAAPPSPDGIDGWLPDSRIPFDYAYQYLAGGVNTGQGWTTWNANAEFPLFYAQGARQHNYIPVLDYYMLLQSNGPCDSCSGGHKDLANLNNPATMAAYYTDFTKLMQRLGSGTWDGIKGFGGTVIVHIEPDLSGFAEQAVLDHGRCYGFCLGQGNNPAMLGAAVADTGIGDLSHYANTYQGFSLALLHLRDLYAPNVLLAFHVSTWATIQDVSTSTGSLNATNLGAEVAAFASLAGVTESPAGTSTYDLLFNDVGDRDSAVSGVWWDRTNRTVPNFTRWEQFVAAVTRGTGKPAMVWQVPLGNQWFRTENGVSGHTQDNRIEYFFAHPTELTSAGIVGVLYGRGNAGNTTNTDDRHDGITNPEPICTNLGGTRVCNDHVSTSADDDGGYVRMESTQYYLNPSPLPATVFAPTKSG